ncbi:MAG: Rrf2 family transcriptional regulator [Defluviitaleaceae bacterium]|nr:Rrf2 family transcriptional regulator [Defluviitaleaceae bacterium]
MLLTKECDYGLRVIRTLSDGQKRTVQVVCDTEHIPHKYAYKILKKLQKAGLVQNKRGPDGGYYLVKPLNTFTLYDVINAIDERLFLFECLRGGAQCPRNTGDAPCTFHHELERLQNMLISEMQSKSMEEMLPTISHN